MHVPLGDTYYFKFTTRSFSTGAPTTLSGTPVLSVYEENNVTQITAGVSVTADYDSVTGLNEAAVVATGANGYEVGKYYDVVITTGTVGGVSVVGEVVGHFRVMPAEDAGAGIPDVNVTHVGDSAQDIATATALATVDTEVGQILADTSTDGVVIAAGQSVASVSGAVGSVTGNVGGNVTGSVGSISGVTFPTNFGDLSITVTTGLVDITQTAADKAWGTATRVLTANTNLNDPTAAAIADAVWDEVINASTHNVGSSAGQRLRQLSSAVVTEGTATAGAATSITLAVGSSAIDNYYNFDVISIVGGTGAGQSRLIVAYNGTTRVATVYRAWATNPDATSEYVIQAKTELLIRNSGLAQAGANNSITLATTASGIDDEYIGSSVLILAGTGEGQLRVITDYNGTTKVASVTDAWAANPDTTSVYAVLPLGRSYVVDIDADSLAKINVEVDSALNTAIPGTPTAGSINDVLADLSAALPASGTLLDDTTTFAEPGSIPAATASLPDKIGLITAIARNKQTQTATTYTLRNSADSGNIGTAGVSDDGTTFTKNGLA